MRDFAHSLPMALLKAREAVMAGFRPDLEAHDLTEQQWRVLRILTEQPGITMGDLAERAALLRPSLSRIVGRLEERALIERAQEERDLRRARLTMTMAGRRLVREIAPRSEQRYRDIEAAYGPDRLAELHRMLDDLVACVDDEALAGVLDGSISEVPVCARRWPAPGRLTSSAPRTPSWSSPTWRGLGPSGSTCSASSCRRRTRTRSTSVGTKSSSTTA